MSEEPASVKRGAKGGSLVVIGASTGGVRALGLLFSSMPALNAAIVLVQHMPVFIQESFVRSLRLQTPMEVEMAKDGDVLRPGIVRVAPADQHCLLEQNRCLRLDSGPKVNFVRPAVDRTMKSVVPCPVPGLLIGVLLTGMGRDGAEGMVHLRNLGGRTVAQDEASCAVFGMPKEAWAAGGVDLLLPPERIAQRLVWWAGAL